MEITIHLSVDEAAWLLALVEQDIATAREIRPDEEPAITPASTAHVIISLYLAAERRRHQLGKRRNDAAG